MDELINGVYVSGLLLSATSCLIFQFNDWWLYKLVFGREAIRKKLKPN